MALGARFFIAQFIVIIALVACKGGGGGGGTSASQEKGATDKGSGNKGNSGGPQTPPTNPDDPIPLPDGPAEDEEIENPIVNSFPTGTTPIPVPTGDLGNLPYYPGAYTVADGAPSPDQVTSGTLPDAKATGPQSLSIQFIFSRQYAAPDSRRVEIQYYLPGDLYTYDLERAVDPNGLWTVIQSHFEGFSVAGLYNLAVKATATDWSPPDAAGIYYYRLRAFRGRNGSATYTRVASQDSGVLSINVPASTTGYPAPAAPIFTMNSTGTLGTMKWVDVSTHETAFEIWRCGPARTRSGAARLGAFLGGLFPYQGLAPTEFLNVDTALKKINQAFNFEAGMKISPNFTPIFANAYASDLEAQIHAHCLAMDPNNWTKLGQQNALDGIGRQGSYSFQDADDRFSFEPRPFLSNLNLPVRAYAYYLVTRSHQNATLLGAVSDATALGRFMGGKPVTTVRNLQRFREDLEFRQDSIGITLKWDDGGNTQRVQAETYQLYRATAPDGKFTRAAIVEGAFPMAHDDFAATAPNKIDVRPLSAVSRPSPIDMDYEAFRAAIEGRLYYKVRACNPAGCGDFSPVFNIKNTQAPTEPLPLGIWQAVNDDTIKRTVYVPGKLKLSSDGKKLEWLVQSRSNYFSARDKNNAQKIIYCTTAPASAPCSAPAEPAPLPNPDVNAAYFFVEASLSPQGPFEMVGFHGTTDGVMQPYTIPKYAKKVKGQPVWYRILRGTANRISIASEPIAVP